MNTRKFTGLALATAAAAIFASAGLAPVAAKEEAKVHCNGVSQCKGQSACQTARNACKGQNSCKGCLYLSKAECGAAQVKMKKDMGGMKQSAIPIFMHTTRHYMRMVFLGGCVLSHFT